jgi:shikimate kinase
MKIALIGMMGTGKTTSGPIIANKLGTNFADLDDIIAYKVGMSISQAFIYFGEKVFRSYETSALSEVVWHENIVISCGGGVTLNVRNMEIMKDFIKVRFIADAEILHQRLKNDFSRPLLKDNSVAALKKIMDEREKHYAAYADITIDTSNKTPEEVADLTIQALKDKGYIKQ